jgi:hypothetical protein
VYPAGPEPIIRHLTFSISAILLYFYCFVIQKHFISNQ